MKIKIAKPQLLYTPVLLNTILLVIGLVIVWQSTRNWMAMLGAFIASLHIAIRIRNKEA